MSSDIANDNQQFNQPEEIQVPPGITSHQNDSAQIGRDEHLERERARRTLDDARIAASAALELALDALARLKEIESMLDK
jgi:hypothetical protein